MKMAISGEELKDLFLNYFTDCKLKVQDLTFNIVYLEGKDRSVIKPEQIEFINLKGISIGDDFDHDDEGDE